MCTAEKTQNVRSYKQLAVTKAHDIHLTCGTCIGQSIPSYQVPVSLVPYAFASKLACDCTSFVKGIVSRDEYFLKACADIVFTIFYYLVYENIKLKVLACSLKLLSNFENPSSNPLERS